MAKYNRRTSDGYGLSSPIPGIFPTPIEAQRNPTTADRGQVGQVWVNLAASTVWFAAGNAAGLTTWSLASPGTSDVDTINGLSPVLGNIVVTGGTNVTDVNGGNTVTLNLDPAITLATSVTSPLYTSAAADVLVQPGGVNDVVLRLGDAAGATFLRVQSSAAADVFTVDSLGVMAFAGLVVTGAFTQTAGIVNIGADAAANAINIGTGAAVKPIIIGNGTGATAVTLNAGTGGVNVGTNAIAHTVTIGNVTGATAVNVNSGTAACAWTTTNGSFGLVTGTGAINLGADAAAKTITIGNTSGATAVNLTSGTGGSAITTTNGIFGVTTGTGAINIGADAFAKIITIGNVTGATALNFNVGTGGTIYTTTNSSFALNTGTGAINLGTDAVAKTLTLGNATGATSVIVNGGTGAMDFGANAIAHTTTLGSLTGAASTVLQAGTGDLILTSADAVTADAVGVFEINSSGAAIGIGSDADAFAINIGTGAAARTITLGNGTGVTSVVINNGTGAFNLGTNATDHTTTLGSTTGVSATVIQSGSGDITVTGTVKTLTSEFVTRSGDSITFQGNPILQSVLTTGAAPTGANGDVNIMMLQEGIAMEEFIIGTQTIIAPRMSANGLLVSLDLTIAEGAEFNFGGARLNNRHAYTIGTSPAFFFELRFRINDMDGAAPYIFGFRKVEANNATYTAYTDYASIGMIAATSVNSIVTATELNSGGTTVTNTTDLWGGDGTINTLTVLVSAAGVVTYLINGVAPTVPAAFTFDAADVVTPFIHLIHSASATQVDLVSMRIGYQA
jgi:hypothetical protein